MDMIKLINDKEFQSVMKRLIGEQGFAAITMNAQYKKKAMRLDLSFDLKEVLPEIANTVRTDAANMLTLLKTVLAMNDAGLLMIGESNCTLIQDIEAVVNAAKGGK